MEHPKSFWHQTCFVLTFHYSWSVLRPGVVPESMAEYICHAGDGCGVTEADIREHSGVCTSTCHPSLAKLCLQAPGVISSWCNNIKILLCCRISILYTVTQNLLVSPLNGHLVSRKMWLFRLTHSKLWHTIQESLFQMSRQSRLPVLPPGLRQVRLLQTGHQHRGQQGHHRALGHQVLRHVERDVSPRHICHICHAAVSGQVLMTQHDTWSPAWLLTHHTHNTRLSLVNLMINNTDIWLVRSAYYEKICLRSPACEKAWIFERAVGYLLQVMMKWWWRW